MSNQGNKPVISFQRGSVQVSVWAKSGEKDGKAYQFHTLSIQQSWKDKQDQWQSNTVHINMGEGLVIAHLLQQAFSQFGVNVRIPEGANDGR